MQIVELHQIARNVFLQMYTACFHINFDSASEPYPLNAEEKRALIDFEELRDYEGEQKLRRMKEKAAAWKKEERARYTYELYANSSNDLELAFAAKEYGMLVPEAYLRGLLELAEAEYQEEQARVAGCSLEQLIELWNALGKTKDFTDEEWRQLANAQKKKMPLATLVMEQEAEQDFAVSTQAAEAAYGKEYLAYRAGVLQSAAEKTPAQTDDYYLKVYETLHGRLSQEEKVEDQNTEVDPALPLHREVYIDLIQHELEGEERFFATLAQRYTKHTEAYFAAVGRYAKEKERVA